MTKCQKTDKIVHTDCRIENVLCWYIISCKSTYRSLKNHQDWGWRKLQVFVIISTNSQKRFKLKSKMADKARISFTCFSFFCLLWKGLNISDTNAVIPIWVSQVWLRSHDRQILSLANYTNRRRPSGSTSLLATLYPSTHTNYPAFQSILCVTGFLYVKHFHLWCLNIIIKTTI